MDEREFLGASLDALDFNAGEARRNVDGLSVSLLRNADANSRASQSHEVSARRISSQLSRAFSDLVTDTHRRIQGCIGLLKDHRNAFSTEALHVSL